MMNSFLNQDHAIAMEGYRVGGGWPEFSLALELVATTDPKPKEVGSYAGTVSVGTAKSDITCSATRNGAGLLKPQLGTGGGANLQVLCMREGDLPNTSALPLVQFEVARTPSQRLYSDLNERRSGSDSEVLPAFLFSQYSFAKADLNIMFDDASAEGNWIARLRGAGMRVPTNQPATDPDVYGIWAATYQRFDAGREIKADVTCYAF